MTLKYNHNILFVDDENSVTKALQRLFRKEDYNTFIASSGQEGLELLQNVSEPISLIISDQRMPKMTGSEFLEKAKEIFPDAIRLLLTGYSDTDAIVDAVNKGEIHRYISKPWCDKTLLLQVKKSLEHYELVLENRRLLALITGQNKELETKVTERTRRIQEKNKELEEVNKKLEKSIFDTIRLLSSLITTLNPTMGKYMSHTARLARKIAEEYGLGKEDLDNIEMAGMIHDIGLLGLPNKILDKDVKELEADELKMFNYHPVIASTCLEPVEKLWEVNEIILHHHEHYDGSGFPNGLKGVEIPLGSRIIGTVSDYCRIVDTWPHDARRIINKSKKLLGIETNDLTVNRPGKVLEEIAQRIVLLGAHKKYDFEVVKHLVKVTGGDERIGQGGFSRKGGSLWIDFRKLQEGMILMSDLRLKDGRLLLVDGTMLNKKSIDTIQRFGERKLIKKHLRISN